MSKSEEIFEDLLKLEDKLWSREDYGEEDLPLMSHAVDFVVEHKDDFIKFLDSKESNMREEFEQFAMAKIKEIAEEYKKFCKDKELYLSMSFIKDEEKGETFNINNDYWKASVRVSAWEQVKE